METLLKSKIALAIIIASLAVAPPLPRLNARCSASAHTADKASDTPSALQGDDAIRDLKERGLYDSLREAVAIAGFKTDDPTFTEKDKLIADDGMANDSFGRSVAIYRDTALVGAPVMTLAPIPIKARPMCLCAATGPHGACSRN
jgi:hypothetical protein